MKLDVSGEKNRNGFFKNGNVRLVICEICEYTTKNGKETIRIVFMECSTGQKDTFYFSTEKGKCWLLKQLLEATGKYKKDEKGFYDFDVNSLLGEIVWVKNELEKSIFRNSKGLEEEVFKNKIKSIYIKDPQDIGTGASANGSTEKPIEFGE
ncbi:MAG: hypothetical protein LBU55_01295 [Elusimicrobiota bacterium]|nr:hypothetical protein [Elusimicrobiota bacterium]